MSAAFFRFVVGRVPVRLMLVAFLAVFVGVSGIAHDASLSTRFGGAMVAAAALAGAGALTAALAPLLLWLEPVPFVVGLLLLPIPTVAGHALDVAILGLATPVLAIAVLAYVVFARRDFARRARRCPA